MQHTTLAAMVRARSRQKRSLTDDQARDVYRAIGTIREVAQAFSLADSLVRKIRAGYSYAAATLELRQQRHWPAE